MNRLSSVAQKAADIFQQQFGPKPRIFTAPGRVNIIGEHTDYNEGFVLPAAIDKIACIAIGPATGHLGRWISADFSSTAEIDFTVIRPHTKGWANYLLGVVDQFRKRGVDVAPFHAVLASDIPIGAGLSSSAAIESAMATALNAVTQAGFDSLELARISQRAENQFIGLQCGIMDMFASIHGREGHVMKIDCRDLTCIYYPLTLGNYKIVLMDTGVKHSLASSAYNQRRQQCEAGVALVAADDPSVKSLRDVTRAVLEQYRETMDPLVYKRCAYVLAEHARVEDVCAALQSGDLVEAGRQMYASHSGLKNEYEVSCPELDLLVELVRNKPGVLGSRMMGGGFGGCTISLIHQEAIAGLKETIGPLYHQRTGKHMQLHEVVTGDGAKEITEL